jgi:outer membrane biosynthesis protein TonB
MTQSRQMGFAVIAVIVLLAVSRAQSPQTSTASAAASDVPSGAGGNLEVLSDTKGVDFNPYLSKLVQQIRKNWYNLIPEEARPPQLAVGKTSIEFAILPTGQFAGMKIVHQSGMVSMDRAAWGGITACNPFDPLPHQFKGEFLALRMHFYYNPQKLPPNEQPIPPPTKIPVEKPDAH